MAFDLGSTLNSIRVRDQRGGGLFTLYARDPTPREQLAYGQEAVMVQKGGVVQNYVRRTRLKYGALLLERCQPAQAPADEGYGFWRENREEGGARRVWAPLTADTQDLPVDVEKVVEEYVALHGEEWCGWLTKQPAWKILLIARAPMHLETVGAVLFEGTAELAQASTAEDDLPNG